MKRGTRRRSSLPGPSRPGPTLARLSERPAWLPGLLWSTGGLLGIAWGVLGVAPDGWPGGVIAAGAGAVSLGIALLLLGSRPLGLAAASSLTLSASAFICLGVYWSGTGRTGWPAILFVYVAVYACVGLGRWRWPVLAVAAAGHLGTVATVAPDAVLGEFLMVWGTAATAGVVVAAAVTATRSAAVERERLLAELRASDAAKTAFLRAAGHDLATPAAVVAGLAEIVIARDGELDVGERARLLDRIAANTRRLRDDLEDLLHLGELADGRIRPSRRSVDVGALVAAAIERAGLRAPDVFVDASVTGAIEVDPARVEHAIANLLTNAAKYAGESGPVEVSMRRTDEHVIIEVSDRGPSIPSDRLDVVFEPFVRARSDDVGSGSGVGLSIVRAFARIHGGDAWAQRRHGGGLRMSFSVGDATAPTQDGEAAADPR